MRRFSVLLATVMVMLLVLPAAAVAAPPLDVTIEVEEFLVADGSFEAFGPAVQEGLLCAEGTTHDVEGTLWMSPNHPWGFNLTVVKEFDCGDGTGTFLVKLKARVFSGGPPASTFHWNVVGGTGAYATLHGSGSGVGSPPTGAYDILDVYSGKMH
jgi:hypothetical protein